MRAAFTGRQPSYSCHRVQTDARAGDLLKRVIEARGGLDALRKVRTVVADADTTFQMEQGPLSSATKTYVAYPDRFRVDATVGDAQVVQVFNAGGAGSKIRLACTRRRRPCATTSRPAFRRDTIPMLIAAAENKLTVKVLPEEGRDGRTLRVLEISGPALAPVKLYIDPQKPDRASVIRCHGSGRPSASGGGSVFRLPQRERHSGAFQGRGVPQRQSDPVARAEERHPQHGSQRHAFRAPPVAS
jgi:hypothetical protein